MTTRKSEYNWRETPIVDMAKALPGEIMSHERCTHKVSGMNGTFHQCAHVTWGIFEGDNGVKITIARDEIRFPGDAIDVFESILRSIDGVIPNEIVTNVG